ncbi:hypothetical protein KPH14_005172 [Odynerus spinipes]|uniref:Uncharacterized protein n=1 Tax=Odynerus spinipes TaxID=1348599 RepID=A0AAD9RLW6_9HYME|nr:hypothetical protein KPH14_005172 [Odynerus spinipes]
MTLDKKKVKTAKEAYSTVRVHSDSPIKFEDLRLRNQTFLKDLELAKARLRTFVAYTPTEEELQQFSSAYRNRLQKRSSA